MQRMIIAASVVILASCAGRAPNPMPVTQAQDATMPCEAIHAEIAANTSQISALGSEQGAKTAQNVAAGVAGLFIWPLWFAMDFQGAATKEVAALEARNSYLAGRTLQTCTAVAQTEEIAPAAGPTARAVDVTGGRVYEPRVTVQPSGGATQTSAVPRTVGTNARSMPVTSEVDSRPPAFPVEVSAAVQSDPCAKYKDTPTESRCRLYATPDGWQYIPVVGRNADLDIQLRCAPWRSNLISYEQCISGS